MKAGQEKFSNEGPSPELHSSLSRTVGHGSSREKRSSIVEVFEKLKTIIAILPHDSKLKLARQADLIRKDPEAAVEIIRNEIEAQREILRLLDNPISTDEALAILDELLPKETVQ